MDDAGDPHASNVSTFKTCLRCDWEGETQAKRCPNCGVPLYVLEAPSLKKVDARGRDHDETAEPEASSTAGTIPSDPQSPRSDSRPSRADVPRSPARTTRSAGTFALAVLVPIVAVGMWLGSREGGSAPASSTAVAEPTPSLGRSDGSSARLLTTPAERTYQAVGGVPFSFRVPAGGWEEFSKISVNKSIVGPQGAEAIVFWTSFPHDDITDRCADMLSQADGRSASDLAAAVASAPGTELMRGPRAATVGRLPAKHVVVTVREDVGCDPGFFFSWDDVAGGAFWPDTPTGSTIRMWIVDVSGTLVVIGAASTVEANAELAREIQQIVRSVRFSAPLG